ncbi:MAG: hypothetical protein PHQ75_15715, partial [Thermoguttaceae bacterium]|nr:hypothetical protein [Thermoguttaceae bacterium]
WHNEKAPWDFAVLTVPQDKLAAYDPPVVPLAGPDVKPLTDRPIYSSGCSEGRWSLAWKGYIESYYGNTAQFYPAPKSGQSGSSIVQNVDGALRVTGVLTWRVGDERSAGEEQMRGGAIPIAHLYDAASGRQRTGTGGSVPPDASWCGESDKLPAIPGGNAPIKSWPVQSARAYFDSPAANYDDLCLFFFVGPGCSACDAAKPAIAKLAKEGYTIETIDASTPDGKQTCNECRVRVWPTYLLCRDTGSKYLALERWSGSDSVEQRVKSAFAKHARRGADKTALTVLPPPPAPKASTPATQGNSSNSSNTDTIATDTARRKRTPRKIETPDDDTPTDAPPATDDTGGGSGDVSPLLGPRTPGTAGPTPTPSTPNPQARSRPRRDDNSVPPPGAADTETGLIDKIAAPLTQRLDKLIGSLEQEAKEKLDTLTTDLSAKAEHIAKEKIDEMKPGIMTTVNNFLWGVVWRAAILIVIVWYGFYWMVRAVGSCMSCAASVIKNLPRIKIELAGKRDTSPAADTHKDGD